MLNPSRLSSLISSTSFPLNRCPPSSGSQSWGYTTRPTGWGIFKRHYGDFCTGADSLIRGSHPISTSGLYVATFGMVENGLDLKLAAQAGEARILAVGTHDARFARGSAHSCAFTVTSGNVTRTAAIAGVLRRIHYVW